MAATTPATWTVIGLRLDVQMSELLIAAVLPGALADDIVRLSTSESEHTRWAMEFRAPDADSAAALAHGYNPNDSSGD